MQDPDVKKMINYAKDFPSDNPKNPLNEEIRFMKDDNRFMQARLTDYYHMNNINHVELANQLSFSNGIKIGLNENSYKMNYIPGHEDCVFNLKYYDSSIRLTADSESWVCLDKNSYIQKLSQIGDKKFQKWLEKFNKNNR